MVLRASGESGPRVTWSHCCSLRRENREKYESIPLMGAVVQKTVSILKAFKSSLCMN